MITNETEVYLFEVTRLEDNSKIIIVAKDFQDLSDDLISTNIEPLEIKQIWEAYITNWILCTKK